ncbi:MAG: PorT family protein [Chitinophagales bacterium]|nr:PorT family protein [Chitinophagales bacterium]
MNSNTLKVNSPDYDSGSGLGTQLGISYRIGNFLYLQPGIRYSWSTYDFTINQPLPNDGHDNFKVHRFGIPIQAGINVIPVANGIINLRFFAGVEPAFAIDVSDNDFGYTKDDINATLVYGTLGAGLDLSLFLFEIGYSEGFGDVLKNDIKSKPGEAFLNVGIRF